MTLPLQKFAVDFQPPQKGMNGATGLYCGEQDMFCLIIDPAGWTEIDGEAVAPGFFLWNSEVGRRSIGIQTFWFQVVCQNHIVWDVVDGAEFTRKHIANVHESLADGVVVVFGLHDGKRQIRLDLEDVISLLRFAAFCRFAMYDHSPLGEEGLFSNLREQVPLRRAHSQQRWGDEF